MEIGGALAEINHRREKPVGRLRISTFKDGARLLLARHLPKFLHLYPVLTDWATPSSPVSTVYPPAKRYNQRVRAFVDRVAKRLADKR